ncbi:MAG: molybdopterin-synthase adenylyltransferase MoeB [Candidatus Manganitrophus sp.]|nr:molybdopterin-synthase adenylyltransferase MoeB [Candidatus Manganitrophus sp.]WDT69565.1 MAG: molybdopterin-synthase adenylyltransferase MoeB [Candidatus Manganitrophus sp.]WDT78834.1 MAG: molybdopterin-synthase adenylyltransferase MoeB [Candidatus Manganitrophus sp.]
MAFTEEQLVRYSRHIILTEVGGKGQKKIGQAKVLIVGAGGLGSPIALYLAAAGVGTIGLIDADVVDLSNLQRQIIHHTSDIGRPKVLSAQEKMVAINSDVKVVPYQENLDADNALKIFNDFDYVIDGTDNFPAKFLINDAAHFAKKPLIHGGILRFEGQLFTILPGTSACYRCIFPEPPPAGLIPTCQEAGVLGALAGLIGTLQGTEVLKLILGIGKPLTDRILKYDALRTQFREIPIRRNPNCPLCGSNPTIRTLEVQESPVCDTDPAPLRSQGMNHQP